MQNLIWKQLSLILHLQHKLWICTCICGFLSGAPVHGVTIGINTAIANTKILLLKNHMSKVRINKQSNYCFENEKDFWVVKKKIHFPRSKEGQTNRWQLHLPTGRIAWKWNIQNKKTINLSLLHSSLNKD